MAVTPNQLAIDAKCFTRSLPQGDLLGMLVYLWNLSGPNMTPENLATAAKCFTRSLPQGDLLGILTYLVNAGGGGGGNLSGIEGASGAYGGSTPNWTPDAGNIGVAIDTGTGRIWWFYNSVWN